MMLVVVLLLLLLLLMLLIDLIAKLHGVFVVANCGQIVVCHLRGQRITADK